MEVGRPWWALTPLEVRRFTRTWPGLREAWLLTKERLAGRDMRGIRQWVFALGWIACAQYHEREMAAMQERIAAAVAVALAEEQARWRVATSLERIRR